MGRSNRYGSVNPKLMLRWISPICAERVSVSPSPRKLFVWYENPTKAPWSPLTPPEKLTDCLPFSFTFSLMSTVPAFTFFFSSAFSGLIGSKYPS